MDSPYRSKGCIAYTVTKEHASERNECASSPWL